MTNDEFIEVVKELEVFFGSRRIIHDQTPEEYISKILLEDGNILTLSKRKWRDSMDVSLSRNWIRMEVHGITVTRQYVIAGSEKGSSSLKIPFSLVLHGDKGSEEVLYLEVPIPERK